MYINYISRLRTSPTDICASAAASTLRKRLQLGLPVPDRGEHQPKDFRRNDDRDLATRTPSVGKDGDSNHETNSLTALLCVAAP